MCFLLTGAEVEGSTIPEAVPVKGVMPETREATAAATEPAEIADGEAAEAAKIARSCGDKSKILKKPHFPLQGCWCLIQVGRGLLHWLNG
jgi:hypothetical protein